MILLTGTGRCGTGFASKVLTKAGVNCTHEVIFRPRDPEETRQEWRARMDNPHWGWVGESSWLAMPFLDWPEMKDVTIVHLIRHPKKVMDSQIRMVFWDGCEYRRYARWASIYAIPEMNDWPRIKDKAALWYLRFNQRIAERADITHHIERPATELLDKLGIEYQPHQVYQNTRYNSRAGHQASDVRLEDISKPLRVELAEMSAVYGYEWPGIATLAKDARSQ